MSPRATFVSRPDDIEAFLATAMRVAMDPTASEADLIALIYGKTNPLLDQTVFADRGAVTARVLSDPTYQVMLDLVALKRSASKRPSP